MVKTADLYIRVSTDDRLIRVIPKEARKKFYAGTVKFIE
jgi:hypothetical protein